MKIELRHIEEIQKDFSALESKEDLVRLLTKAKQFLYGKEAVKPVQLKFLTYYANPDFCKNRYQAFKIKKKSGGERIINAPVKGLKAILKPLTVKI